MTGYDFIGCAKRMGAVLLGRTEPSVSAVHDVAHDFVKTARRAPTSLRALWQHTVDEPVPDHLLELVSSLGKEDWRHARH